MRSISPLPAAGLERADQAIVHRGTDVLVLGAVRLRARREQRLLFLQSDPAVAFGFLLCLDRHAESMERRRRQVRRILVSIHV